LVFGGPGDRLGAVVHGFFRAGNRVGFGPLGWMYCAEDRLRFRGPSGILQVSGRNGINETNRPEVCLYT